VGEWVSGEWPRVPLSYYQSQASPSNNGRGNSWTRKSIVSGEYIADALLAIDVISVTHVVSSTAGMIIILTETSHS
jgi:hypothetical protein